MKVIVIGCGRLGTELAYQLYKKGHEVAVVDSVASAFKNLPADFQGRMCEGEALNQDVLRRAGIEEADALAAVTNMDALNIVVCHVASTMYRVPKVIARNYDPHCRQLFEDFDLQVVSSASWGAQRVEEMLYHAEMRPVFSAGNGEVEVYEVTIPDEWNGRLLTELVSGLACQPVAVTRAGKAVLPAPDTRLVACDVVHISATSEGIEGIRIRLNSHLEEK